jgi:hypothetical protein
MSLFTRPTVRRQLLSLREVPDSVTPAFSENVARERRVHVRTEACLAVGIYSQIQQALGLDEEALSFLKRDLAPLEQLPNLCFKGLRSGAGIARL